MVTRLVIEPEKTKMFPVRFCKFAEKLEQAPGFKHYRLITNDENGSAYTLITFWQTQADARQGKLKYFPKQIIVM